MFFSLFMFQMSIENMIYDFSEGLLVWTSFEKHEIVRDCFWAIDRKLRKKVMMQQTRIIGSITHI